MRSLLLFLRERNLTHYVENFEEAKNFNIIDIHTKLCILIIIIVMKNSVLMVKK